MTQTTLSDAQALDQQDPLRAFRDQFYLPHHNGRPDLYFVGNSLGLQPKSTPDYVAEELEKWQQFGVRGHFTEPRPWFSYHEVLTETMANLVGGQPDEVVMMNSLTVNLHLMMATFYRPTAQRHQIMIEAHAFPSDKNATQSQLQLHGFDAPTGLIELQPDQGEIFSTDAICQSIRDHRDTLALILLPGVQYYTGQVFDMERITKVAHEFEIPIGFDLAHAAGNVPLNLHQWDVDFACWCSYKYLNSGPGSVAGCFVNRRHASNTSLPRMAGWWGHDKKTRFQMSGEFAAIETAEGWQLSNPPILSLAAIRASLDVFKAAGGMPSLREKSVKQTSFFNACLEARLGDQVQPIYSAENAGCQLSLEVKLEGIEGKGVYEQLESNGIRTDWREPNVIRAAPTPLYNSFEDIWRFVDTLENCL